MSENADANANALNANAIFYYTNGGFMSYAKGVYIHAENSNNLIKLRSVEETSIATLYDGKENQRSGSYIINIKNTADDAGRYIYGAKDDGIVDSGQSKPTTDNNYCWWLEEVTSLPVTIKSVRFATFYAPVAVEIPDGVTAYYLTSEGVKENSISMTGIENGVIPANTGVILEGEEGTYSFAITGDVDAIENNLFAGTVAAEYITEDAYVLSAPGGDDTKLGLYTAAFNQSGNTAFKNNSHKAYLPKDVLTTVAQNSNGFTFDFEGTTAIEDVNVEEAEINAIYDLQGRKVENPTKGIYIINGNKVIIK